MKICHRLLIALLPAACAIILGGCASTSQQLQSVNKDWDQLIRASHIYPIYPPTQDIQPGDIFLTTYDMEDASVWSSGGYMKLDHQIARLYPTNYPAFYANSFALGTNALPQYWLKANQWSNAPAAAFPSYAFRVVNGGGVSVALPVEGVPVGLAIIGASSASGVVTIGDCHTYGVDEISLTDQIKHYICTNAASILSVLPAGTPENQLNYLNVVTRVFTTGQVTISMTRDSSVSASASGGVPKDTDIPLMQNTNAVANYTNFIGAINSNLASLRTAINTATGVLPGGTLKVASVGSRAPRHRQRKFLPRVREAVIAEIERAAALRQPAHDDLVRRDHLLAVDAQVLPGFQRPARDREAPGDQRSGIARPAGLDRQPGKIDVLALPHDFLAGRAGPHGRRHVEHLLQHRQLVPGVLQSLGRIRLLQIREQLAHFTQRRHRFLAHAERDAPRRAEQIRQHRNARTALRSIESFWVFEQNGGAAGLEHAVAHLGHLQVRIDLHRHALQFALSFQLRDEVAQILVAHE